MIQKSDILRVAQLCARSYTETPTIGSPDGACRAHVYGTSLIFEGTSDVDSILADEDIITINHPIVGWVHDGFWESLDDQLSELLKLTHLTEIGGHSLGAAHAILFSAILADRGLVLPTYCYEPPRVTGDLTLQKLVTAHNIPVFACRNGNDIVTEIPSWMRFPTILTRIGVPSEPWDNIDDHEIDKVIESLQEYILV